MRLCLWIVYFSKFEGQGIHGFILQAHMSWRVPTTSPRLEQLSSVWPAVWAWLSVNVTGRSTSLIVTS